MLTPAVFMVWFGYMAHLSQGEGGRLSLPFAITTCYAKACVGGQVKTAALFMYAVVQQSSLCTNDSSDLIYVPIRRNMFQCFYFYLCPYTPLCYLWLRPPLSLRPTGFGKLKKGKYFCPKIMLKIQQVEWGRKIMMGLNWTILQQKLGRLFEAIFKVFQTKLFCILPNYKVICSMLNCKSTVNIELDGWISLLRACLQRHGSSLGSNPDISQKYKMGDIQVSKDGAKNTLARQKILEKTLRHTK